MNDVITEWLNSKKTLQNYSKLFEYFFEKAIFYAKNKEKTYFGFKKNSLSLLVGGIYLSAWVSSGIDKGLWMLLDNRLTNILNNEEFSISIVKSTKNLDFKLYWLHTNNPLNLQIINNSIDLWESFSKASLRIFQTRHGRFEREDFINNKFPIKYFLKKDTFNLENLIQDDNNEVQKSLNDSRENRLNRLNNASTLVKKYRAISTYYVRNPDVVAETLFRANGYCERCGKTAPFLKKSNKQPYLEVHHKKALSKGGKDTLDNSIALCPDCHRELHFGV